MSPLPNFPRNIFARDIMTKKLITLRPEMDVFRGVEVLIKNKISGAPVIDKEQNLLGIFSEKSVMQVLISAAYEQLPTNRIDAFMDKTPHTIGEDAQLLTIAQVFLTTPRRRLPVLRDGKLVGQISRRDVLRAVFDFVQINKKSAKPLLYLSALREMNEAPEV